MKTIIAWFVRRNNDKYSNEVEALKLGAKDKTYFQLMATKESYPDNKLIQLITDDELAIRKRIENISDSLLIGTIPTLLGVILGFVLGLLA